jgi:hypothetical protein
MDALKEAGFDFVELAKLADNDPAGFAQRRAELIRCLIEKSSHPVDLANLQFELDASRFRNVPGVPAGLEMVGRMLENANRLSAYAAEMCALMDDGAAGSPKKAA